jgi:hypothetical protein
MAATTRSLGLTFRKLARGAPLGAARRCTTDAASEAAESIKQRAAQQPATLQLYRDVMRLTYHIAARSAKGEAMRTIARTEFRKHAKETDPTRIVELKDAGIRAISNYVVYAHAKVYKDAAKGKKS